MAVEYYQSNAFISDVTIYIYETTKFSDSSDGKVTSLIFYEIITDQSSNNRPTNQPTGRPTDRHEGS